MRTWLKKRRKSMRMTQIEVANKAGISRPYYTRIENSIRGNNLPVSTAQRIALVLKFDWRQFYEDKKQ